MLCLDGVYAEDAYGKVRFHRIKAPTADELGALVHRISQRVAKFLERRGFLARDEDNDYLALETADDEAMQQLYGHSITYRIAIGPQQGRPQGVHIAEPATDTRTEGGFEPGRQGSGFQLACRGSGAGA